MVMGVMCGGKLSRRCFLFTVAIRLLAYLLVWIMNSAKIAGRKFATPPPCILFLKRARRYFNLLYAMIDDAIAHEGVRSLRFGATTYYTKRRMGCRLEPVDLHFYVRGMPSMLHSVVSGVLTDAVVEAANFDG